MDQKEMLEKLVVLLNTADCIQQHLINPENSEVSFEIHMMLQNCIDLVEQL